MNEVKDLILGDLSIAYYLAAGFFALLAIILSLLMHSKKRDVASPNTPYKFSFWFLILDNFRRMVAGMITMFLIFRFANEFIGRQLNMFWAVLIGIFLITYGVDKILQFLKQKANFLNVDRTALTANVNAAHAAAIK